MAYPASSSYQMLQRLSDKNCKSWENLFSQIIIFKYREVISTSPSYLETHAGFQIVYEGEIWCLLSVTFWKKLISIS